MVNGITSGIAAPSALGIPLTRRGACHGAMLVTGHCADDAGADPDWRVIAAAARSGLTLVIYMGISRLDSIVDALRDGGLDAATPAAIVQNATLPEQRALLSTLGRLSADSAANAFGSCGSGVTRIRRGVAVASKYASAAALISSQPLGQL